MEGWPGWEMDDCEAVGAFLVHCFGEDEHGGVVSCGGEGGDFADAELVAVAVGGAGDVVAVWEEGAEGAGFGVEVGVYAGCYEDFGGWWGF